MLRPVSHDWESDARPLSEILTAWRNQYGWSDAEAAQQLRIPLASFQGYVYGRRSCGRSGSREGTIRRLMTLIDLLDQSTNT